MVYAWSKDERIVTQETLQKVLDDGLFFAATLAEEESNNHGTFIRNGNTER
jgi:hypothetical protein